MRILIETQNLIDFPYRTDAGKIFQFNNEKVDGLVYEILYGWPTCYLVSGYRGAGKTSFLKKVEEKCKQENARKENAKKLLFVYSNFSRFENRTNFLRKIIRDLKETLADESKGAEESVVAELDELYKKTFYAVKQEHVKESQEEDSTEFTLNTKEFIQKIIKALSPIVLPLVAEPLYYLIPAASAAKTYEWIIKTIVFLASILLAFYNTLQVTTKYTVKTTESHKNSEESLTDDDIINYYLERLIDKFSDAQYRLIFVLDELDKVDDTELESLLKEMKPWLVRGMADFIIVAGQRLTMKYYQLRDGDDELLASLFSKVVHINLLPQYNFEIIFNDFLFKGFAKNNVDEFELKSFAEMEGLEAEQVAQLRDHYIYRSKRLPRTFMNLIRQDLKWKQNQAYLEVPNTKYDCEKKKSEILKNLFEKVSLNALIPETAADYLNMYLYRVSASVDCAADTELIPDKIPEDYPYLARFLKNFRDEFLQTAVNNGLTKIFQPVQPVTEKIKEETAEVKKEESTKEEMPNVIDAGLQKFRDDFLSFFNNLIKHFSFFSPVQVADGPINLSFQYLVNEYNNRRVFLFPTITDPIINQPIKYFQSRINDYEIFKGLRNLFASYSIRIASLHESLFKEFCLRTIKENMNGRFSAGAEIRPSLKEVAHFIILRNTDEGNDYAIAFRYQYIEGPISISQDDTGKLASYLEELNLVSNTGNYIIQIIFTSETNSDFEKEEVNASVKIKSIRPDFTDRIRYILLPTAWANDLKGKLIRISETLVPYQTGAVENREKAKQTSESRKTRTSQKKAPQPGATGIHYPDDIQKGRWGMLSERNNRKITATVRKDPDEKKWFYVNLKVESTRADHPLSGKVTFHLHDSFDPDQVTVIARNNVAEIKDLGCYEAFTVGASCDNNTTFLELDLNELKDAPDDFKYQR